MERVLWGIVILVIHYGDCKRHTLTTAAAREYTFPKPTKSVDNRIEVVFRANAHKRSRTPDVWDWDFHCRLQPKNGNCTENLQRYHYNLQMDQCVLFKYSGCDGNKNNFNTELECEQYCKGSNYLKIKKPKLPKLCFLQYDTGSCFAFLTKYYYDVNEDSCKSFLYGGCGGNQNRFDTFLDCKYYCQS